MVKLPRILVLDDITGWSRQLRRRLCEELALTDADATNSGDAKSELLAEAVFNPCQLVDGIHLRNDEQVALDAIAHGWDGSPDGRWALVLLDLQFNQGKFEGDQPDPARPRSWPKSPDPQFGLNILKAMARRWPDPEVPGKTAVPVVVLSARPRGELEAQLNSLGNLGYLEREGRDGNPVSPHALRRQLADHLFYFGLLEDGMFPLIEGGHVVMGRKPRRILGKSLALLLALRKARQAAESDLACLLLGPSGAGKELFARYIHELSRRRTHELVIVNCPAFPDTLIESELFGYAPKSGIQNANPQGKPGAFEVADGGTVFMDEIAELSPQAQAKVLRFLQEKTVQRLSSIQGQKVNVRIIAATNKDLHQQAEQSQFRDDLIRRLEGFVIRIPPLGERLDDVPMLFDHFLEEETRKVHGGVWPKRVSKSVYADLKDRAWTGNVRELEILARKIAHVRRFSPEIVPNDVIGPLEPSMFQDQRTHPHQKSATASSEPEGQVVSLERACRVLTQIDLKGTRQEIAGILQPLAIAYGRLLRRLLETALEATREPSNRDDRDADLGDLSPTKAVKLLMGAQTLGTAKAASEILRIARLFPEGELIDPKSPLGIVLKWAARRRRTASKGDATDHS